MKKFICGGGRVKNGENRPVLRFGVATLHVVGVGLGRWLMFGFQRVSPHHSSRGGVGFNVN